MENPLKEKRITLGLTQKDIAIALEVTEQYIRKLEQGLYTHVPVEYLKQLQYPPDFWEQATDLYHDWKVEMRQLQGQKLRRWINSRRFKSWQEFRKTAFPGGVMEFCKALCCHPQVVATFESKPREKLTWTLRCILIDAGLSTEEIMKLEEGWAT